MAIQRKAISKKLRFEVFKRDSFRCQYCGASAPEAILHVDHIHPVSKGGDNDITNLITSCVDCNQGKKDRLLSDNATVAKQKAQLDELNQKREQLEMMLTWRKELKRLDETALKSAREAWAEIADPYQANEKGAETLRKLINKFGLSMVLDAIEKSQRYIQYDKDGGATIESVNLAFSKIGGICNISSQPDHLKALHYVKGICRNRFNYCNDQVLIKRLKEAYEAGVEVDDLKAMALECRNWTQMMQAIDEAMEALNG